ncbi:MAG TPA: HD domain-containing phosphohydrolase [Syntrophorhabdaceae bacterium]|nr:HD domain-containing phosphohydrolase [Syntrophorhabdaceae bacterium]
MTETDQTSTPPIKILLVDAEPSYRKMLSVFFSKYPGFNTFEAENGAKGYQIALETRPDLIISDYYMPVMNGIDFCKKVKGTQELSSVIFLLLTAEKEVSHQTEAFEHGADDYIVKTTTPVILTSKIRAFLRIKLLQKELQLEKEKLAEANAVLERNFTELTAILLKTIDFRLPGASDRAEIAKQIAEHICKTMKLSIDEKQKIIFGAQLHEIGKIGLPDNIANKLLGTISPDEKTVFNQYPAIGAFIVSAISGFKAAADSIHYQLENYDGSGVPDGLIAKEISAGATILRSIVLQEELTKAGHTKEEILQQIRQSSNKILDPAVAMSLAEFIIESDKDFSHNKYKIHVEELQAGMVIAEDVYAISGVKLIPKGIKLQEHTLKILLERHDRDPIIGGVYVFKAGSGE